MRIPFNIPVTSIDSAENVKTLANQPLLLIQKHFTKQCEHWFESTFPNYYATLVTSCTKAMELIALSIDIQEGDEVIMPSYTYVGVANSFANLGATIVFLDIDPETMNIDATAIESSITQKTKCVIITHYGGVACDIPTITEVCNRRKVFLIEDNAQGFGAKFNEQYLGQFGDFTCVSFDSQKNISCGEGGLLLYKKAFIDCISTGFENGTNRGAFSKGLVPYYEWVNRGSNFSISEYNAAVLYPLIIQSDDINSKRKQIWLNLFTSIYNDETIRHLLTPKLLEFDHNGHIFFLKCKSKEERDGLSSYLNRKGIGCSFHFSPLHTSQRAKKAGFQINQDQYTTLESNKLLRIPMHNYLSPLNIQEIVTELNNYFTSILK